jgi:hypothetical protein
MEKVKSIFGKVVKAVGSFYKANPKWIWLTVGFGLGFYVGAKLF